MSEQELLQLIKERKSSRVPFDADRPVDPAALSAILEATRWGPTAHNMQNFEIVAINDKAVLARLSELKAPTSPVFVQENYRQLSFSEEELRQKKTGILASQFPDEWMTPEAQAGALEQTARPLGDQVSRGPVLLLVLYDPSRRAPASEGDFLGVMSLGFALENLWLMATAEGLAFHIISAFGNEPLTSEVKELLGSAATPQITLGIRLGYPLQEPQRLRVRRAVEDFVSFNHYGARAQDQ